MSSELDQFMNDGSSSRSAADANGGALLMQNVVKSIIHTKKPTSSSGKSSMPRKSKGLMAPVIGKKRGSLHGSSGGSLHGKAAARVSPPLASLHSSES